MPTLKIPLIKRIVYLVLIYICIHLIIALGVFLFKGITLDNYPAWISSRLDSKHYLDIAQAGYSKGNEYLFAFFPLFPIEIYVMKSIFGINAYLSALFATGLNFVALGLILSIFVSKFTAFKNSNINQNAFFSLSLVMPFLCFIFVPYTEGLFLFLMFSIFTLIFFYKNSKYLIVLLPVSSLLIALTRNVSVAIIPVYLYILFVEFFRKNSYSLIEKLKAKRILFSSILLSLVTFCIGFFGFMYYGYLITSKFTISAEAQKYWGKSFSLNIFSPIIQRIQQIFDIEYLRSVCSTYQTCPESIFVELFSILFILFILIIIGVKMAKTYKNIALYIFSLVVLISPLFANSLVSYNRYMIVAPVYNIMLPMMLISNLNKKISTVLIILLCLLNFVLLFFHIVGFWIG